MSLMCPKEGCKQKARYVRSRKEDAGRGCRLAGLFDVAGQANTEELI